MGLLRPLARINVWLTRAGVLVAAGFLVIMTAAVILQVASRELRAPIGWTEEVALASMVWLAFLVGPFAYRQHEFTRIDVVHDALPERMRRVVNLGIHLFEAALLIGAVYLSWQFYQRGTSLLPALTRLLRDMAGPVLGAEAAGGLAMRNSSVYIVLPLGFAGLLLVCIEHILRAGLTLRTGRDWRVGAGDGHVRGHAGVTGADLPGSDAQGHDRP